MHTVITTNNAYDTILLVDENDRVVSKWEATPENIASYINATDATDWDAGHMAPDDATDIASYGEEVGRDGDLGCRTQYYA